MNRGTPSVVVKVASLVVLGIASVQSACSPSGGTKEDGSIRLETPDGQVRVSIRSDSDATEATVTAENVSGTRVTVVTNIPAVVQAQFMGLPTRAKFKLRDSNGIIELKSSDSEGWFSPAVLSANLSTHDNPETSATSLATGQREDWKFSFAELPNGLPPDFRSAFEGSDVEMKLAVQFLVEGAYGRRDPYMIETEWFKPK